MPTIEDNISCYGKEYEWPNEGNEWSVPWGGTPYLWHGTIFPRIFPFLPTTTILEIAPGFGRCTQYFINLCEHLQIVDLNKNCIDHCKNRFKDYNTIDYYINNGKTLEMISDQSIDFVFSWDSLVHCESEVLESYIKECSRILKPNGIGFFHHSNIGQYYDASLKKISCENLHGRGETMSAALFKKYCDENQLICINQEIINWGGSILNDCLSLFTKRMDKKHFTDNLFINSEFHKEVHSINAIAKMYNIKRF
jgi:2-polyprenyl-3-methyl-5-hydroxy-6-metoxy-1,4-benzoquinol methylase